MGDNGGQRGGHRRAKGYKKEDKGGQKWTETKGNKGGQRGTEGDKGGQRGTEGDKGGTKIERVAPHGGQNVCSKPKLFLGVEPHKTQLRASRSGSKDTGI